MGNQEKKSAFDAIVVGSGPSGATIARELSRQKKKVLILERGVDVPLKESIRTFARILDTVSVSDDLVAMRALTTGGTTAFYGAIAEFPPLQSFRALGIDLAKEIDAVKAELSPAALSDELLGPQVFRVQESATELGHAWLKRPMLVDQSKCSSGYSYEAKWNARTYLHEAVQAGATLETRATARRVLVEDGTAVGVEYQVHKGSKEVEIRHAHAAKIILAAGALASPIILRNSGIRNIASRGFYTDPCMTMIATVPGLKGRDSFVGSMGTGFDDDISYGDASFSRFLYRMWMLGAKKFLRLFSHSKMIGVGIILRDGLGGKLLDDGRYYKQLTREESMKLQKAESAAVRILQNAGGKNILKSGVSSAHVGGLVRIHEHLDDTLQTEYSNLHVCDGSMIPESIRLSPTLTLICLGKYLANRLAPSL